MLARPIAVLLWIAWIQSAVASLGQICQAASDFRPTHVHSGQCDITQANCVGESATCYFDWDEENNECDVSSPTDVNACCTQKGGTTVTGQATCGTFPTDTIEAANSCDDPVTIGEFTFSARLWTGFLATRNGCCGSGESVCGAANTWTLSAYANAVDCSGTAEDVSRELYWGVGADSCTPIDDATDPTLRSKSVTCYGETGMTYHWYTSTDCSGTAAVTAPLVAGVCSPAPAQVTANAMILMSDLDADACHQGPDHGGGGDDDGGSSNPCFARETTTACRVHDIAAPPADAYAQCFLDESGAAAERVLMTSLSAGDYVLTQAADGALAHTRVILNQHKVARDSDASSPLLTLYHERGTLGLSPDHVLRVGGEFGPARTATAGADLAAADGKSARVSRVEVSRGGVVNPLTVAGTILAAGPTGAPVLASVYGEWIADYFLGVATYPLPYSLGSALAYLFPEHVQAYYDTVLEPPFLAGAAHLKSISAAAPDAVIGAIVFGFDLALGAGFAAYALAAHAKVAVALAAVGAAAVYKKRKSA